MLIQIKENTRELMEVLGGLSQVIVVAAGMKLFVKALHFISL